MADNRVMLIVGAKIDEFRSRMGEVTSTLGDVQNKMQGVGEKMQGIGEKMTLISAPIALLGGAAAKTAMDFETANARMQTQLGLTAAEAQKLSGVAKEVWKNGFGANIGEASEAVAMLKQQLGDIPDAELKAAAESAFVLQDAFGADIQQSTATASVMMKNFGIDSQTAFDLMTVGFQKGGDYSGELLDTMREYGPAFSSMGMSAEDMMGTLIAGAEAGAWNLDKVGDSIKEFNIRAKDGSKTTAEGFAAIGLNAQTMGAAIAEGGAKGEQAFQATLAGLAAMEDPVARNAAGVALFGTQWEDLESDVVLAMANGGAALGEFEGASAKAGQTVSDTFGARLTTAFRGLQEALLPLGNVLLGVFEKAMPYITAFSAKLAAMFNGMGPGAQVAVVAIGAFLAALGPILVVVGHIITAFAGFLGAIKKIFPYLKTAWSWFGKLRTAFTVVRTALLALSGPIGWVIIAITALIAIGIALYKNWDTVKAKVTAAMNAIKTVGSAAFGALKSAVIRKIAELISSLMTKVAKIKSLFKIDLVGIGGDIVAGLARGITGGWGEIKKSVQGLADKIPQWAKDKLGIASPSKVADKEVGQMWGSGVVRGVMKSGRAVANASQWLADRMIPDVSGYSLQPSIDYDGTLSGVASAAMSGVGSFGPGTVSGDDSSRSYVLDVPLSVDGREIARATARFTEEELARFRSNRQRAAGVVTR